MLHSSRSKEVFSRPCRSKASTLPDGQITKKLSSPLAKNIPLSLSGKSSLQARPVPSHHEGRLAIVTKRGTGCGGRLRRSRTRGARCGRRSRVVPTPRRWRQVSRELFPRGDGGKQARSPGRARRKPLKPLRRECRVMPVCTCGDYARVLFHFAREAAGALRARHSLRPLISGRMVHAKLGRYSRGGKVKLWL